MIHIRKPIPELNIDHSEYKPFIKNDWFRKNYMWFAYGLMIILFWMAFIFGGFRAGNLITKILIYMAVYPIHESIHILTVMGKGDIYLSHSGLYFWLTPDVELSKIRLWIFMTMPLIVLTGIPAVASFFTPEKVSEYLRYIAWINAITAGSDIINSVLIAIKPSRTVFYRGFYKRNK